MIVTCENCGIQASTKCPSSRTIFPLEEHKGENIFWMGKGYKIGPAGKGWQQGTQSLTLTSIVMPEETQEQALTRLFLEIQQIPEADMEQYVCRHTYFHSEDCHICGHVMAV